MWGHCLIAVDGGGLTVPFPVPNSRYEPFAPTEFQFVDDPEMTLRFDHPGEAGYERLTLQGPMRWQWRTAIGVRIPATSWTGSDFEEPQARNLGGHARDGGCFPKDAPPSRPRSRSSVRGRDLFAAATEAPAGRAVPPASAAC